MSKKIISESDLTTCNQYLDYINNYLSYYKYYDLRKLSFNTENPSVYCERLSTWIDEIFGKNINYINSFITEMTQSIKNDKGDFSWLKGERISYFTWLCLKDSISYDASMFQALDRTIPALVKTPPLPILDKPCSDMISRIEVIKGYFETWNVSEKEKASVVFNIKSEWAKVDKLKHPFKQLEANKDVALIKWTWDYLVNNIKKRRLDYPIINDIQPTTANEKYHAIFAIHDYIYTSHEDMHKVFCMEYRQALSSKKFREKETTKIINVQLKVDVKEKLDFLKEHYRWNQQQILEKLINEHYSLIKDKIE